MRQVPFQLTAEYVAAVHLVLALLLVLLPLIPNPFHARNRSVIEPIDFVVDVTPLGDGDAEEDEEEAEVAKPVATVEPADAVVKPIEKPVTTKPPTVKAPPKPTTKVQVQRSTKKIKRTVGGSTTAGKPTGLTPDEIRRRLAMGARAGTYNSAIPSEEAMHFGTIYRVLYEAWVQPSAATVGRANVTAELRFAPDGSIVGRRLVTRSGVREMDASVEQALNAVDRVPGLSVAFLSGHRQVTVLFEVQE
jgi:hypothetical protein